MTYRDGETNHCPGCARSQWIIGRLSAECAFCSTALPLNRPDVRIGEKRVPVLILRAA
jgi:glutaredoxin 2